MLCDFFPIYTSNNVSTNFGLAISVPEIILIIWVITYVMEEVRQILHSEHRSVLKKLKSYLNDLLNVIEIMALVLFLIGMILRLIPNRECYIAGRLFLCVDLIFWFIRNLYAYTFIRNLGPKILMIIGMVNTISN